MKKIALLLFILFFLGAGASSVGAADIALYDWAFNIDENLFEGLADYPGAPSAPIPGLNASAFNWGTGLGTLTWTTSTSGDHSFIAFFDHEIVETTNTYYNEYGKAVNESELEITQSWEIDEPGWREENPGNIYSHVLGGALDNLNGVPIGYIDDVSWAMGWDFILGENETAIVRMILSDTAPQSGFYLAQTDQTDQTDPDSNQSIYFSSSIAIVPAETPIPEPSTALLLGAGLLGLAGFGRKRFKNKK